MHLLPKTQNRICSAMVSVLASSTVDHGFESRSWQPNDDNTGMCCLSVKHSALRRKSKYWWTQVTFWWGDDDICIVQDQLAELFVVLYHWNNRLQLHSHVDPPGEHIILIPNQSLFGLNSYFCVHSGETTNINFIIFDLFRPRIDLTIYCILKGQANDYTTEDECKRRHADNNCLTKQGDITMYVVPTMKLRILMVKRWK